MVRHGLNGRTKAGNEWMPDQIVRVGFMRLRVIGCQVVKDGMPDIYTLASLDGNKTYEFIPHNGLHLISDDSGSLTLPYALLGLAAYMIYWMIAHGVFQALTALQGVR